MDGEPGSRGLPGKRVRTYKTKECYGNGGCGLGGVYDHIKEKLLII
jgi:hypothetical protein